MNDPMRNIERRLSELQTTASNRVGANYRETLWMLGLIESYRTQLQSVYDELSGGDYSEENPFPAERTSLIADELWNALTYNPEKL